MCKRSSFGFRLLGAVVRNDEEVKLHTHGYSHERYENEKRLTKWYVRDKLSQLSYGSASPSRRDSNPHPSMNSRCTPKRQSPWFVKSSTKWSSRSLFASTAFCESKQTPLLPTAFTIGSGHTRLHLREMETVITTFGRPKDRYLRTVIVTM